MVAQSDHHVAFFLPKRPFLVLDLERDFFSDLGEAELSSLYLVL